MGNGTDRVLINRWQKPLNGYVKVTFHGAVDRQGKQCGLGIVVRDWHGCFSAARAIHEHYAIDQLMVETLAVRES